ncbi:MAG: hypothetical protein JW806_04525 [Sedimentisphaerales bacterium]|nr:hypothetical protein [Sedimentisphaerales bacterium]
MKTILMVFIFAFLFSLICIGCIKPGSQNKWKRYKSLDELYPRLKNEIIESIDFCDEDPEIDVESWYVYGKVPKESLEYVKEMIIGELGQGIPAEKYPALTCQGMLKIVTNKGKYVAPIQEYIPQNNWEEHASLVGVWPRLQQENITSISFCDGIQGLDIDLWSCQDIPEGNLNECIKLLVNAMQSADPNNFDWTAIWQGRMKIITDKGKYLVPAEVEINNTNPKVYGNEWVSSELGKYLKKSGFLSIEKK